MTSSAPFTDEGSRSEDLGYVLDRVFDTARVTDYEGWSKHDALNAPWLERLAGRSRPRRLVATQSVMRSPVDVRRLARVKRARNAKGLSLFARGLLARYRMTGSDERRARKRPGCSTGWSSTRRPPPGRMAPCPAWRGAIRIRGRTSASSRRATSRTGSSRPSSARPCWTAYGTLGRRAPPGRGQSERSSSWSTAPTTLFEDERHRCVSYVPDPAVTWIVMDVSVLSGALAARLAALNGDAALMEEAGRLVRYVVTQADRRRRLVLRRPALGQPHHARQLPHRFHPGRHRRVHRRLRQRRVRGGLRQGAGLLPRPAVRARRRGPVHERPALAGRHPRLRPGHHHLLAATATGAAEAGRWRTACWTGPWPTCGTRAAAGSLPEAARHPHQHPRAALVPGLDVVGAGPAPRDTPRDPGGRPMRGFPGRELALDPSRSRFERALRPHPGRPGQRAAHPVAAGAPRHGRRLPQDPRRRLGPGRVLLRAREAPSRGRGARRGQRPGRRRACQRGGGAGRADAVPVRRARRDAARLRRAVRPGGQRRQPRARRGRRQRHAGAAGTRCGPGAVWSSTSPATSGVGSSSGGG